MENTDNIIVLQEGIEKQILKEKVKKPRSDKQLENDKKLGQRLKDKKLKEQQQLELLDRHCEEDLNLLSPPVKKIVRPKLARSKSIRNCPTIVDIREEIATA